MKLPIFHGKFLTTTYQIRDDLHSYINNSDDLNFYLPIFFVFVFALCIRILVPTKNCVKQNSLDILKKGIILFKSHSMGAESVTKGHIISKCLFGFFNFSLKNENKST